MTSYDGSLLEARERRIREARSMNLMSNTFMSVVLNDAPACQHVLRILTHIPDLIVKRLRTQYRISQLTSHDAILDVLAEDARGQLYNIEIQRTNTIDHARRTRFYGALIDSEYLDKGKEYYALPEVYIIYISESDLWNGRKTCYTVRSFFDDSTTPYEDGTHRLYINTAIDDGSAVAQLMQYFKTADPEDMSQGALSKRVHYLKREEGGYSIMCELSDKWFHEGVAFGEKQGIAIGEKQGIAIGEKQGIEKKARETALAMADLGFPIDTIARIVQFNIPLVSKWLAEGSQALQHPYEGSDHS